MLLWIQTAVAMDVMLTLSPATGGALRETLRCTVTDVKKGELLTLPAQSVGESTVVPMVEIGGVGHWGVVWLSALRVTSSAGDYPGLISIAQPDKGLQTRIPCEISSTCQHTYTRDEQSMTLSITASGDAPGSAMPEELIWKTTSWYREAREVDCEPVAN